MAEQMDWSKTLGAGYFRDRTVLITGASSGIGRDIAMSPSRMGAQVAMLARRKALLDELKRQVESAGARALALGADVTHASEVRTAVDRALEMFGAIDILVNSAGVLIPDNVESMDPADLEHRKRHREVALFRLKDAVRECARQSPEPLGQGVYPGRRRSTGS